MTLRPSIRLNLVENGADLVYLAHVGLFTSCDLQEVQGHRRKLHRLLEKLSFIDFTADANAEACDVIVDFIVSSTAVVSMEITIRSFNVITVCITVCF